ncbi:MAG: squalene/phytoene synthase family protein [Alphaproteobacteria bacterium]|nr:squalene/phytoene synthase family protein [Alphaproteobacteria bacterium]
MLSVGGIVKKSQPSLFWCTRALPKSEREAVYTLFAFCQHIDGIVRSTMAPEEKSELLQAWREELDNIYDKGVPASNIGRKIYKNCMRFDLPKVAWKEILDSALLNAAKPLQAPDIETFEKYINGMAVVPLKLALSVVANTHPSANEELAKNLGRAVMVTYMLRDIKDDAKNGHLYIPREILAKAGVKIDTPRNMVENKNLTLARESFSKQVESCFKKADRLLGKMNSNDIMPLKLIKNICYCQYEIMKERGWEIISPKPKIGLMRRIGIVYQTMFK